jgi:ABC-type sulfate transport system permease component
MLHRRMRWPNRRVSLRVSKKRQYAPRQTRAARLQLTLGYTLLYLSLIVLIPLSALVFKTFTLTLGPVLGAGEHPA